MRNVLLLSPLLHQLMPGLEVKDVLAELRERIIEECDYELEASNHRRVERFWRAHPFIRVPVVDTGLSRRRVLVTEWVDGMSFDEVARQPDAIRDFYAQTLYRFF
jgi:predicted unusual protein kinase regulating ubiquinone biosynthesis (AarF/ABC1/UbiB family)